MFVLCPESLLRLLLTNLLRKYVLSKNIKIGCYHFVIGSTFETLIYGEQTTYQFYFMCG